MIIGYARISTEEQSLDVQIDEIRDYSSKFSEDIEIFKEKETTRKERKQLKMAMKMARKGDTLVVYKLDRLARSTKELYTITDELQEKGVKFVSLSDNID